MKAIKNFKVVSSILKENIPNYKFDRLDVLLLFSIPSNMKIFFIGNNDQGKTLFKHSNSDVCYYDILHANKAYYNSLELLYELDSDDYCTDLESIEELVKKYNKRKEEIV